MGKGKAEEPPNEELGKGKAEEPPNEELIRLVQNGYKSASGPGFTRRLLLRRAKGAGDERQPAEHGRKRGR